jgi:hypothetical protein
VRSARRPALSRRSRQSRGSGGARSRSALCQSRCAGGPRRRRRRSSRVSTWAPAGLVSCRPHLEGQTRSATLAGQSERAAESSEIGRPSPWGLVALARLEPRTPSNACTTGRWNGASPQGRMTGAERPQASLPRSPLDSEAEYPPLTPLYLCRRHSQAEEPERGDVPPAAQERAPPRGEMRCSGSMCRRLGSPSKTCPHGIARRGAFQGPRGTISGWSAPPADHPTQLSASNARRRRTTARRRQTFGKG